MMDILWRRYFM